MLLSVMILVGSAVLRRAAATQNAAANGMSGIAAAPSMPGPGNAASYAPKEYVKVGNNFNTVLVAFSCSWPRACLADVQLPNCPPEWAGKVRHAARYALKNKAKVGCTL